MAGRTPTFGIARYLEGRERRRLACYALTFACAEEGIAACVAVVGRTSTVSVLATMMLVWNIAKLAYY
jgi:hypothetical protein